MIRYYLNEDPILPNVETFLLSEEKDRRHVLANLDKLVVKAVGESGGYGMLIGPKSSARQREDFARQIEANPRNYIAQPTLDFSRAPCLVDDRLEPRHVDLRPLRTFWRQSKHRARRTDARGARKRIARSQLFARRRKQGHMGSGISLIREHRAGGERSTMLSRVADSLYWMSRYLERAENTSRLLDVTMGLMLDPGGANAEQRWQRMTAALGRPVGIEWNGSLEAMARKLVFDHLDPSSVTYCINGARENARQVREEISTEQWQRLNRLFHHIHSPSAQAQYASSVSDMLASVVDGIHLFQGVGDSTMIHGQGWQFIRLGRYLERAYATATLLEVYRSELFQAHERETRAISISSLVGLLRCCTAFEAYCQVYTADLSPNASSSSSF
jgi:uncharacterized alpha-E superfamily protein